ncbi:MAG: efflux RND transporter periplasmic adaptor subunit [Planctomycetales bacterium]|nr:efflux RND transporter periplasmic adaptor subunit [Planctomycetales bacterium]
MRTFIKLVIGLAILGGICVAAYYPIAKYLKERNKVTYRTSKVTEGSLTFNVNATGTVEPVLRVTVGAVVSGNVNELFVDFNDRVEQNQLMARIDPKIYESNVQRDQAMLDTRLAEVKRAEAKLQQAVNSEQRARKLTEGGSSFLSETEVEELQFSRMAAEADLSVAQTAVKQATANLENSKTNLEYTEIRSPVDGIVVDRKIDVGQTLASQFQTPELFIVAPELDCRVYIFASVDEADIGLIRDAQTQSQPVNFSVDAYPNIVFEEGKILEVRLSSSTEQNVVTYPVVVETPNPDMKLLPGMTANLSFQIENVDKCLKVPNAALRFYPPNRKLVHPDDHAILDGVESSKQESLSQNPEAQSVTESAVINRARNRRHVWVVENDLLRAREVEVGISDSRFSELVSGDLDEGDELVVGEQLKK